MNRDEAAKVLVENWIALGIIRSCLNCCEFNRKRDICDKFNIRPPAKVIVYSCGENWVGEIPF